MTTEVYETVRQFLREALLDNREFIERDIYPYQVESRAGVCLTNPLGLVWTPVCYEVKPDALDGLIEDSRSDRLAYDAALALAEHFLVGGQPLPRPLAEFVIHALHGHEGERPQKKRGISPTKNHRRDLTIHRAVSLAMRLDGDLKPTRNEASSVVSASDVVADCLQEIGITGLGYSAVAKIYGSIEQFHRTGF